MQINDWLANKKNYCCEIPWQVDWRCPGRTWHRQEFLWSPTQWPVRMSHRWSRVSGWQVSLSCLSSPDFLPPVKIFVEEYIYQHLFTSITFLPLYATFKKCHSRSEIRSVTSAAETLPAVVARERNCASEGRHRLRSPQCQLSNCLRQTVQQ